MLVKRFIEILLLLLGATKGYPPTHPIMQHCEEQKAREEEERAKGIEEDEEREEREMWEFIRKWGS